MASRKGKIHKPTDKKKRRNTLQTVYYLASFVFLVIRIILFFWDRFNR